MSRKKLLKELIKMEGDTEIILKELDGFGWNSNEDLVVLKKDDVASILLRYLNNKIDENAVESWANHIECREDIGIEKVFNISIKEVIHELANPDLTFKLTKKRAEFLINKLNHDYKK